jgi:hypothetical protein
MAPRPLTLPELGLLIFLLRGKSRMAELLTVIHTAQVEELDGGMGSLRFSSPKLNRRLGEVFARTRYLDADGVPVFVALYLDEEGDLYELDSWKSDDTPLQRIPAF